MRHESPNKPDAVNPAIALRFQVGHRWRGVTDPERWPAMESSLPNSKSAHSPDERAKIKRVVVDRGLTGLANDTKWDELIEVMRGREGWTPSYRCKCVDGPISGWDTEWYYHLPFPMISVEWFDIAFIQRERPHRLRDPAVTDHAAWIESALAEIGLDYRRSESMIRVFGYAPRSAEAFDT